MKGLTVKGKLIEPRPLPKGIWLLDPKGVVIGLLCRESAAVEVSSGRSRYVARRTLQRILGPGQPLSRPAAEKESADAPN